MTMKNEEYMLKNAKYPYPCRKKIVKKTLK